MLYWDDRPEVVNAVQLATLWLADPDPEDVVVLINRCENKNIEFFAEALEIFCEAIEGKSTFTKKLNVGVWGKDSHAAVLGAVQDGRLKNLCRLELLRDEEDIGYTYHDEAIALSHCIETGKCSNLERLIARLQLDESDTSAVLSAVASGEAPNLKIVNVCGSCDAMAKEKVSKAIFNKKLCKLETLIPIELKDHLGILRLPEEFAGKGNGSILAFLRDQEQHDTDRSVTAQQHVGRYATEGTLEYIAGVLQNSSGRSEEELGYQLLVHQREMLERGCSQGRLSLNALWLIFEYEGKRLAHPLCPRLQPQKVLVHPKLAVHISSDVDLQNWSHDQRMLNSVIRLVLENKNLKVIKPKGNFVGILWHGSDDDYVNEVQLATETYFQPIPFGEHGTLLVHKTDKDSLQRGIDRQFIQSIRQRHSFQEPKVGTIQSGPVFISHTGKDDTARNFAAHLSQEMEEDGIKHFYDVEIPLGDTWKDSIHEAVVTCSAFVAILSPTYFKRYWCMRELDLAHTRGRKILPVYYSLSGPKDKNYPQDKNAFFKGFEKDTRVQEGDLDKWWINVSRILPDIQHRTSTTSTSKDADVVLKKEVVKRVRCLVKPNDSPKSVLSIIPPPPDELDAFCPSQL